jgi:hypothetical protein
MKQSVGMPPALFRATTQFRTEHIALYNFVHGTTAALWNTRWQVNGYLSAVPDASRDDLEHRFVTGSGIHGVNVKRTFVEQGWLEHAEQLARVTLMNTVALYEAWAEDFVSAFGKKSLAKDLQFPTKGYHGATGRGVGDALADMTKTNSASLGAELVPVLERQRSFHEDKLDALLAVYRYFKELRNAEVHGGGLASNALVTVHQTMTGLTAKDLGVKEFPEHHRPELGTRTPISLRGVIGFGGVIYSIVTTLDGLSAPTQTGELEFVDRVRVSYNGATLPSRDPERSQRISLIIRQAGLPRLESVRLLGETLKQHGVIF